MSMLRTASVGDRRRLGLLEPHLEAVDLPFVSS